MTGRDSNEENRAATMIELLYDLVFVIAIATAAESLHHAIIENHIGQGVISFAMSFFSIWWAWMGFTWFASSYDTNDVPYRMAVFIQMIGALILAAGIENASESMDFTLALYGYVVIRLSQVGLWIRVAIYSVKDRPGAITSLVGISLCQIGWVLFVLYSPKEFFIPLFILLVGCELLVPYLANKKATIRFHKHHIIERYGLLTIIVLGECFLAVATGIEYVSGHFEKGLALTVFSGVVITLSMWWLYFENTNYEMMDSEKGAFTWGYLHVIIFASVAAVGVGLSVMNDLFHGDGAISISVGAASVAVPLILHMLSIWYLYDRKATCQLYLKWQIPLSAVAVVVSILLPYPTVLMSIICVALITIRHITFVKTGEKLRLN